MSDFQDKLQQLPEHVRDYLVSSQATEINISIYDKHGIETGQASTLTRLIGQVFFKELKLPQLQKKIKQELDLGDDKVKPLVRDIAGSRLLIIDDWLDEDVGEFIRNLGGDPQQYQQDIQDLKEAVKKEKEQEKKEEEEEEEGEAERGKKEDSSGDEQEYKSAPKREVDPEKEKKESLDVFKSSLSYLLELEDEEILEDYNLILIRLFLDDSEGKFRKDLEKSLLANQEKLTDKKFTLEEEEKSPTVGNWLNYFIKQYGSEMFNNITLSEFLANSSNAKALDKEEKEKVRKLLLLYRNIKFFFQIYQDQKPDQWQVFPISSQAPSSSQEEVEEGSGAEKKTPDQKEESPQTPSDPKIKELEGQKQEYPEGSLERKAIEEEIKKIKKSHSGQVDAGQDPSTGSGQDPSTGSGQEEIGEESLDSGQEPPSRQEEEKEKEPETEKTSPEEKEGDPQAPSDPKIKELEEQKQEYPEGSLERKAIEEEIKKIKNS